MFSNALIPLGKILGNLFIFEHTKQDSLANLNKTGKEISYDISKKKAIPGI